MAPTSCRVSEPILNSDRFLDSFSSIERCLRKITKKGKGVRFYALVDAACKFNHAVGRFRDDLKEYADLRNAIVHERTDGHVIAEPNDQAVEKIKHIASLLLNPPKVIPLFQTEVYTLSVSDPIAKAAKGIFDQSFSQIPIYYGHRFAGLLTTNTVARWLGACVKDDLFSLAETLITHVLSFTEDQNNFSFLSSHATLFDALARFQDWERIGKRLEAILITQNGKPTEPLIGIVTIWDLPKLHKTLMHP